MTHLVFMFRLDGEDTYSVLESFSVHLDGRSEHTLSNNLTGDVSSQWWSMIVRWV